MRPIENLHDVTKDPVSKPAAEQRPIKKTAVPVFSARIQKGQKVYQLDLNTMEVTEAVYKTTNAVYNKEWDIWESHRALEVKPRCLYIPAINKTNAERKFLRMVEAGPEKYMIQ